jgi:RHS repeat-associated protein
LRFAVLGYDNADRRTSLGYSNGVTTSYAYDLASRLTNLTHNGPSGIIEALTYAYDAAGNRFSTTRANGTASLVPSAVASAAYDAANEQTAFAGATLTYDANGNLTNDGVNTYQWDARNRLIAISGGASANFSYDVLGRRTSKTINSVASQFLYDGKDMVAEIGGGAVGASFLRSLNIDEPFIRQTSTGNEHYHSDALGSSLALSNAQGASAMTYTYEPFGKTTVTGTSSSAFQYTGRENDGTGLYYYRNRYYSPMRHRFVTEDPVKSRRKGFSLYEYVSGNPLRFIDPLGLEQFETCTHSGGCGLPIDIPPSIDPEHVRNAIIERWPPTSPLDDLLDYVGEKFKNSTVDVLEGEARKRAERALLFILEGCLRNPIICLLQPPQDAEAFFPGPEPNPPLGGRK